jgi:ATP-binding cassette subfamily B protein
MEQLEGVFTMPAEEKPKDARDTGALADIAFAGVTFGYRGSGRPALEGVSLQIRAGETVAFVGPSGSGKSTLIKLLVGLYKSESGTLTFNGIPGAEVDYAHLRRRIGLVLQETQLFAGTIRDNLLFVRPGASDGECIAALRLAQAESILSRSGADLDTRIGEGGIKLSGGERQRLAIARALLRNPQLIIFDEATSSLDSITEKAITRTIRTIAHERPDLMNVLVAHRLSTVMHADTIYVLERGKIVEEGTHGALLERGGLYAALWREQSASDEAVPEGEAAARPAIA